jgi:hypothetical protein
VIAFFGIIAWIYAGICFVAIHAASHLPPAQDPKLRSHALSQLWASGIIAFLAGAAMIWFGIRWAMASDMSDPDHPNKPKVRW